ncbi:MAG: hypothetical protein K6T83_03180 [Alicyclobacillus sp.]|nr:hypothetical protein [Alicyclobacillus sp.]
MAMNSGEQGIINALQSAVSLFRANLSAFVPDIYAYETPDAQNQIMNWWQNPNNTLVVQPGFNTGPVQGLSWNVTIGAEDEITDKRVIGTLATVQGGSETDVTPFDSAYVIGVLGVNQNWLRWSQMLCKWALLYYRQPMETQYGLLNQRISLGGLQPVPDDLKDAVTFAYMRTVVLRASHADTWTQLEVPTIEAVNVNVDPNYEFLGG